MPTVVNDPQPVELERLIERRRRLAQDLFDEVWNGILHMNPAPGGRHAAIDQQLAELLGPLARQAGLTPTGAINVGVDQDDFRVPDRALHREAPDRVWHPTAALVVEIVSPGDESWNKLDFYAERDVDEVLIVDPQERRVHWMGLAGEQYEPLQKSGLIELGPDELTALIDWP
jgi:Uma2 family endonuclease